MAPKTRDEHLFGDGPKRLLALDGGGIRGAVSLGYLSRIEAILRERAGGDPDFRLCDYFDLIGGTSTGSIIATLLALGRSVAEIEESYKQLADEVFSENFFRLGVFGAKFPKDPLVHALTRYLGDETLGSDKLRTGLMVVTKRLDTGSPWLFHNNPRGRFYADAQGAVPNRDLTLLSLVGASVAAPHYFKPELIRIAPGLAGAFVDGGVSPYHNPALQLLMVATLGGYGLRWPMGEDNMLVVSVGTGFRDLHLPADDVMQMTAVELAARSMLSIVSDTCWQSQEILQWMSRSPTAWRIDSEIGDLDGDSVVSGQALISYLRYDLSLEPAWLRDILGVELTEHECDGLFAMDNAKNVHRLTALGNRAGAVQVQPNHFRAAFDV